MAKVNFNNRTLFISDNLPVLRGLNSATIDLIYLDPPFNSKKQYKAPIGTKAEGQKFDDTWRWTDLDERWLGEIDRRNEGLGAVIQAARQIQGDGTAAYLTMIGIRLLELRRVLKPTGSLYLHCDPTASHYLKASMDAIFGKENFRNELVWKRTSAHSRARRYGPIHDIVFFYSRGGRYVWNNIYQPYDEAYVEKAYRQMDKKGGRHRLEVLTGPGTREGSSGLPWRGYDPTLSGRHWALPSISAMPGWFESPAGFSEMSTQERLDVLNEQGLVYIPKKKGGVPNFKRYLSVMQGRLVQDVFTDIAPIAAGAERTGWATQKPLALLQRIIRASSNPGDIVLDPFAGCATCLVAAEMEGRRWIGVEACEAASDIVQVRLDEADLGALGDAAEVKGKVHIERLPPKREDLDLTDEPTRGATTYRTYRTRDNMDYLYGKQRGICNGCGNHYHAKDLDFDHIIPQVADGSDELENLQLLCGHCNSTKGNGTMQDLAYRLRKQKEEQEAKRRGMGLELSV